MCCIYMNMEYGVYIYIYFFLYEAWSLFPALSFPSRAALWGAVCGQLEPAGTGSWKQALHVPSQLLIQWRHVGGKTPAMVGVSVQQD